MPCFSSGTESMESSMYVDFCIVSAAIGNSLLCFCAWRCNTNCAWNGDEFTPNTTRLNSYISGGWLWLVPLHRDRWYGLSSFDKPIRRYISAMPHTIATGNRRKRSNTSNKSCCSFGPWYITSFKDTPSYFAEASKTIRVFVVSLSGLTTGKCGRYHFEMDCSFFGILLI